MFESIKNEMLKPLQEEYDQIEQNKKELESKRDMLNAKLKNFIVYLLKV